MSKSKKNGMLQKKGAVDAVTILVQPETLKAAPWNPEIRVQLRYLGDLRASMEADGFWEYAPMLVDRNGIIIDGHRRWVTARLLGIKFVPVTIVDDDADRIWAMYNGTRMDLTGAQSLQAVAQGLKTRPPKYAPLIARLEAVVGEEGLRDLGRRGASPYVMHRAMQITRYCSLEEDRAFIKKAIYWLVEHARMTAITARAMQENIKPEVIESAIRTDQPLVTSYR